MKPLISGTAAVIIGAIGTAVLAGAPFIPAPWGTVAGLVGFLACSLAGLSAAAPVFAEGKPILQGAVLTAATAALGLLSTAYPALPSGWPQSVALAVAGVLALLTGKAMPALGSPSHAALEAAKLQGVKASASLGSLGPNEAARILGSK